MNNSKRVTSYIKNGERSKQCLLNGIQMELDYEQAGCKDPKKTSRVRNRSNQLKLDTQMSNE